MGYYIDPPDSTKETFLKLHGQELSSLPTEHENEEGVVVCLVNNGPFTAAAICFNDDELKEFSNPKDYRPKTWYRVEANLLAPYCALFNQEPSP